MRVLYEFCIFECLCLCLDPTKPNVFYVFDFLFTSIAAIVSVCEPPSSIYL